MHNKSTKENKPKHTHRKNMYDLVGRVKSVWDSLGGRVGMLLLMEHIFNYLYAGSYNI